MPQNREEPSQTSEKKHAQGSRENIPPGKHSGEDDFKSTVDLPGKTDSGPEPDVAGKEIPPQP